MKPSARVPATDFAGITGVLRADIDATGTKVRNLMQTPLLYDDIPVPDVNKPECRANVILAFRHLEDARMRLGKAIQASEGGVSIYDKPRAA